MVAELADAQDLGSCPERGEGSSPSHRNPQKHEGIITRPIHAEILFAGDGYFEEPFTPSVQGKTAERRYALGRCSLCMQKHA